MALSDTGMRLRLRVVACPIRDIVSRCLNCGSASSSSATGNESTFVAMSKFYGNVGIWTGPLGTIPPVIEVTSLKKLYEHIDDFGILKWSTSAVCFGPPWAQQTSTLDLSVSLDLEA